MSETVQRIQSSAETAYRPLAARAERLPVLALRGAGVGTQAFEALLEHEQLEVAVVDHPTPSWRSFARHVARSVVVATTRNPFAALTYARNAGIVANLVLGISAKYRGDINALVACGAAAVFVLPIEHSDVDRFVDAILRDDSSVKAGSAPDLVLDSVSLRAHSRRRSVRLTQREFAVLHRLSLSGGRPVSSEQILDYVWGSDDAPIERSDQIVRVYISHLRKRLDRLNLARAIATVRGLGYALKAATWHCR